MEKLKIEKIVIGTQYENSENYKKFIEIVKSKNLNVVVMQKGKRLNIEKVAEEKILKEINPEILKSDILKVAHHGSKTSTTQGLLDNVEPKIALIGVGKDNNFGHPSGEVIERLESKNIKIYRTDEDGEIVLEVNRNGKISIMNE